MKSVSLMPLAGINRVQEDEALQVGGKAPRLFVREALNVDISPNGKARMRPGARIVSSTPLQCLWQSPLHGDTFAMLADQWVKVDTSTWAAEPLATIGAGPVAHLVLNGAVLAAGREGIFSYNGAAAQRFTLDAPAPPMVSAGGGSLEAGSYSVAIAWLRGALESPLSEAVACTVADDGGLQVTLPLCLDASVTQARLYFTRQNGGELLRGVDCPASTPSVDVPLLPQLGAQAPFRHMEAMPTGTHLAYWKGRLVTASGSVLRFSEALAYHVHDPRHGFVQMPQRITFVSPVEAGLWVGQVDHVVFLQGATPDALDLQSRATRAPVPGSAVSLPAGLAGELAQGGAGCVVWLADNGYVIGTPSGQAIEAMARTMKGVRAAAGTSVVFGERVLTAII